ncbi:hypothetical protein PENSPDRAFT_656809 [Peniophora sp. CONT]|nr:hypothetical protein PENSPDRAFT_656809 [Peniophora sp. CONT]
MNVTQLGHADPGCGGVSPGGYDTCKGRNNRASYPMLQIVRAALCDRDYGHTNTINVYGGKIITDPLAHQVVREAIDDGKSLHVSNASIGGGEDPWPAMTKSCAVYYHHNSLYKARVAQENQTLHFEQDVLKITYGGEEIRDQAVYLRFLRAISQRERLSVTSDKYMEALCDSICRRVRYAGS